MRRKEPPYVYDTKRFNLKRLAAIATGLVLAAGMASAQPMRPSDAYRTAGTDRHEIIIQKNGRLDVFGLGRQAIFENMYPMIWFDGDDAPMPMAIDGRYTARNAIKDSLGLGQELYFEKSGYEWSIRVYPLQPFITVRCAFTNRKKRDVVVRGLSPWCGGAPKKGGISSAVFGRDALLYGGDSRWTSPLSRRALLSDAPSHSFHQLVVARDAGSPRHLVAAFLDHGTTRYFENTITLESSGDGRAVAGIRSASRLPRPVVLAPGERIESPSLYIALSENDVVGALERYGEALALWTGKGQGPPPVHGWIGGEPVVDSDGRWADIAMTDILPKPREAKTNIDKSVPPPRWSWSLKALEPGVNRFATPVMPRELHRLLAPAKKDTLSLKPSILLTGQPLAGGAMVEGCIYDLRASNPLRNVALRTLAESFFYMPNAHRPVLLTEANNDLNALRSVFALAALSGGRVYGNTDMAGKSAAFSIAKRATTTRWPRAVPFDVFGDRPARAWHTAIPMGSGTVWFAALFNDTASVDEQRLSLANLPMGGQRFVSVYDVWNQAYLGTAQDSITIETPARGVRVLALQVDDDAPTVLSAGDSLSLGFDAIKGIRWDPSQLIFSGTISAATELRVLVPEELFVRSVRVGNDEVAYSVDGRVLRFAVTEAGGGHWIVSYGRQP